MSEGFLPVVRVGKVTRISQDDLDTFLQTHRSPAYTQNMAFFENEHGIHLVSPYDSNVAICGSLRDGATDEIYGEEELLPARSTSRNIVTCPHCAAIVLACRGIRVA